VVIKVGERFQ